jgi:uncharacterized secreted protein with C-terminal beta-propeller domain
VATFVIGLALFVNIVYEGMDSMDWESDRIESILDDDSGNIGDSERVVVTGEDGRIYLIPKNLLENKIVDSVEDRDTKSKDSSLVEDGTSEDVKTFSSMEQFRVYVENHTSEYYTYWGDFRIGGSFINTPTVFVEDIDDSGGIIGTGLAIENDFSTTNNQVSGVDEGDIVKNDGKYAYIVSNDRSSVFIVDAHPAEDVGIVSTINTSGSIREIYITQDKLVVIGWRQVYLIDPIPINVVTDESAVDGEYDSVQLQKGESYFFNYITYSATFIDVYDIEDRSLPFLYDTHLWRGSLYQSRMIGDHLYLVTTQTINRYVQEWDLPVSVEDIYFFNDSNNASLAYNYQQLTTILSVDITDSNAMMNTKVILMDPSGHIFVSLNNIYITENYYYNNDENTTIHRISINDGEIQYKAKGDVTGRIMSRFSMDEYNNHFRVATTKRWTTSHGVYVLDMDMELVGCVEGIAPLEQMYSARFMGKRAYLVTFRRVDPFFVINLTDPASPKVMGELIIPGWSDYLHPYDENHVIGLGREATGRGWRQGIKLSLFDVTNVSDPKEISKYVIGDSYSRTIAASNPHAFLFDKEESLLVIPVWLNYTYSAAHVFHISLEKGFELKGIIDHPIDPDSQYYNWGYRNYNNEIKRAFYIENTLYTLSNSYLKANNLDDLNEINIMRLPKKEPYTTGLSIICLELGPISR